MARVPASWTPPFPNLTGWSQCCAGNSEMVDSQLARRCASKNSGEKLGYQRGIPAFEVKSEIINSY
jgi:hypothetical protein